MNTEKNLQIQNMSTVQKQMDNMNIGEGDAIVGEDENEQKGIAGLNELLEQELKEEDSVDRYIPLHCFMDEDVRKYTSKFRLSNEDDASVVPDATLYSPKEGASTDNNSSTLETEDEIPDNSEKEVPFEVVSDAENLQSCEEGNPSGTVVKCTDVETADQGTNEIKDTGEEDMVNKNGLDPVQNKEESSLVPEEVESGLKDQINEQHNVVEQNSKGNSEEETNIGRETTEEAHDSVEVTDSEMQNSTPKESEEAANSQSSQDENATGVSKGILYDALPPEDEKTECKENTTSTGTINTSNPAPDKPVLSPVLKISSSSEAKNVKAIHKPIVITARLVKNNSEVTTKSTDNYLVSDNINSEHIVTNLKSYRIVKVSAVTTKAADNFGVSDLTREDTDSNTKSAESEGKKHNGSDEPKGEETKKEVQNDDAVNLNVLTPKVIITKKVCGNTKKSPLSVQEKKVPNTEASSADTQNHHHNTDEDKDVNMDNGVKASVNTEVLVGTEGKTSIKKSVLGKKVGGSCIEKGETDFAAVKRKFEEVSRISRQEEEAAVREIKKMKKETLDVLKKINGEMKKLKLIFLAGN